MKHFHKQRLLKLANFLETQVPDENFDIGTFVNACTIESLKEHKCGTAACAIGYMPLVFPRLVKYDDKAGLVYVKLRLDESLNNEFEIAMRVFGIDWQQTRYLFVGSYYGYGNYREVTKQKVVERIRKFVENDGDIYK